MASDRILLIENPAELSIDTGRLRIRREPLPDAFVAPDDVAVLVLHHSTVQVSHSALRTLAAAGAIVIVTDATHMPSACMLPTQANRASPSRLRLQIDQMSTPIPDVLWQSLVQGRIRTQAATLRHFGCNGALRLERMVSEVDPGDATHREGQAARHYWQYLFDDFKRSKQGAQDPVNTRLNYGYAVLRALVARELAAAGLSPELGLGHVSIENPSPMISWSHSASLSSGGSR
jgi:CRISPR-associated protein Cas1